MKVEDIESKIRKELIVKFPAAAAIDADKLSMENVAEWDSMAQVEIVVALEQFFGIEADTQLIEARSLHALVHAVEALREGTASNKSSCTR